MQKCIEINHEKMKKSFLVVGATVFAASALLMSCNSSANKVEDAQENVIDARNDMVEAEDDLAIANAEYLADVENYRVETNARIEKNKAMMANLRAKMNYGKEQTKEAYNKYIDDLEQQNNDLQNKMDEYKADTNENWEQFKAEFNHDMQELENGFNSLGTNDIK